MGIQNGLDRSHLCAVSCADLYCWFLFQVLGRNLEGVVNSAMDMKKKWGKTCASSGEEVGGTTCCLYQVVLTFTFAFCYHLHY
jgi:hypothetical protein